MVPHKPIWYFYMAPKSALSDTVKVHRKCTPHDSGHCAKIQGNMARSRQNLPLGKTFHKGPNTHIAATTWYIVINTL